MSCLQETLLVVEAVATAGPCDDLPRPAGASQTGQGAEPMTVPVG